MRRSHVMFLATLALFVFVAGSFVAAVPRSTLPLSWP